MLLPSTVSRSASPLPCAIQRPSQTRITGSSAVTRPPAGTTHRMPGPSFSCMYGSRFDTRYSFFPPSSARMWSLRRSAVQGGSARASRPEAFSALARAMARLFAIRVTSEIRGSSVESIFGRSAGLTVLVFPVRTSRIHTAIWAIGPVMLQRTTISVIATTSTNRIRKRTRLFLQISSSRTSMYEAF